MPNYLGVSTDNIRVIGVNITPVAVGTAGVNGGMGEQMFPVPGLRVGDFVAVTAPDTAVPTALCAARVSAQDTLALTFVRTGNALVTPAAGLYLVLVAR